MTDQELKDLFASLAEKQKETWAQIEAERKAREEDRKAQELQREAERKAREAERAAHKEKLEAECKVYEAERAAARREEERIKKEIWAEMGGIGRRNGEFAENLFFHSLEKSKTFAGVHFDIVSNKFKKAQKMPNDIKLEDQFDIVMLNDNAVAIIEVKYSAQSDDPKEMIERKVPNFRTLFSDYADFKIYLGLGSFSFDDRTTKEAEKLGIGLLKVSGDMVEYKTDWVRAY